MSEVRLASTNECVGAALRFVRTNVRFVALTAAIGAGASSVIALLALGLSGAGAMLAPLLTVLSGMVMATIYAALIRGAHGQETAFSTRLVADGLRVWAAMVVVGFFMLIAMFAFLIPASIVLSPFIMPYAAEIRAASENPTAMMAIFQRFFTANPAPVLIVALLGFAVWMVLTSRLYLAAAATIEARRILTFDTWSWTKHNMLRIVGARLMLLGPAWVFAQMLSLLVGRVLGFDAMQSNALPALATQNPLGFAGFSLVSEFITIAIYISLEGGLVAAFYQVLKRAPPSPATPPPA